MTTFISYGELDQLMGELLPERTVLSASSSGAAAGGGGGDNIIINDDDGALSHSACQSTYSPGTPGLLGSLGLGSANPGTSQTCTPAAVATY